MLNTVTVWICRCGIELTVASERDPNDSDATATAVCPTCREHRVIHTGQISSIAERLTDDQRRMFLAKRRAV